MTKQLSPELFLAASLLLGLIPIFITVATCYLKFSIVLSLLRTGFGTQQAPSNSLVMALSLVMSLAVMEPVGREVWGRVQGWRLQDLGRLSLPLLAERTAEALTPWKSFLVQHSGEKELGTFMNLSGSAEDLPADAKRSNEPQVVAILSAFVLSEIKRGFVIAFAVLLPCFVIDVVVANVLVGLGLTMMSPVVVSLPLKLLLFISCDGWLLLSQSLIESYR